MRKSIWFTGVFAVALSLATGNYAAAQETIKIGMLLPHKGIYATLAESFQKGWDIAYEEFGGEAGGKKIVLVREDTEATPNIAIQKATRLIQSDKVDLLAGIVSGGVGVGMGQFAEQRKIPLILGFAIPDVITAKNCNPYVTRTSFSAYAYTSALGKYWATKYNTASTLGPDYATGHAMIDGFAEGFEKAGKKIINKHFAPFKSTKDYGTFFAKIKEDKAEMLFSFFAGGESILVIKQYHDFGMKEAQGPLYGDLFLYDPALWPAMGDAVVGGIFGIIAHPLVDTPANKAFNEAFQKANGVLPDVNAVLGYDNGKAIMLALKAANGDVSDPVTFGQTLRKVEFDSPRGKFRFNKDGNAQIDKIYLIKVEKEGDKIVPKIIDTLAGGSDRPGCEGKS